MVKFESITDQNVSEVVSVHMDAFHGYMNASMGRGYVRRFLMWFAKQPDAIAVVAVDGGRVVGYVVGAPVGYERPLSRDLFWVVAAAAAVRPWLLFRESFRKRLAQRAARFFFPRPARPDVPDLPEPLMSLVGIGVSASGRGGGIGRKLLMEFEELCRQRQMRAMRLSVYADNVVARGLYERGGWKLFTPADPAAVYYYRLL
jgi:ribosomal protein S18 acetylase RimI-like enzyme